MSKARAPQAVGPAKKPLRGEHLAESRRATLRPPSPALKPSWRPRESDVHELVLRADDSPLPDLPSSIEAAILDVLEQVPGGSDLASRPPPRGRNSSPPRK